jgi:hypothetical protein
MDCFKRHMIQSPLHATASLWAPLVPSQGQLHVDWNKVPPTYPGIERHSDALHETTERLTALRANIDVDKVFLTVVTDSQSSMSANAAEVHIRSRLNGLDGLNPTDVRRALTVHLEP